MNGDLRVSFKPVPATNYARMTVSVNGTRFRMTLKHIIPSGFQEELMSLSSTLFRIYKESLLQHKPITAKELKSSLRPPLLRYYMTPYIDPVLLIFSVLVKQYLLNNISSN